MDNCPEALTTTKPAPVTTAAGVSKSTLPMAGLNTTQLLTADEGDESSEDVILAKHVFERRADTINEGMPDRVTLQDSVAESGLT